MLYYEVKLIDAETKEVYFEEISVKPKFPTPDFYTRHRNAILVIRTLNIVR